LSQLFVDAQGRRGRRVPVPSARPHGSPRPRHRHPTRRRSDADPAAVPRDEEWVGRSIHAPVSAAGLARPVDGRSELRGRPRPAAQGADRGSRPEVHRRRGRRDTARGSSRVSTPTMITVLGRRTRVRLEGDPDSPPVLLLHGSGRGLEDWAPQYPRLAGAHRVIALDLPGSGFSARAPEPTTLEVLARGVLETLDTLGERRPLHVIGNSLGGAVAMQLLVLDPARVASLVLVDSAGFGTPRPSCSPMPVTCRSSNAPTPSPPACWRSSQTQSQPRRRGVGAAARARRYSMGNIDGLDLGRFGVWTFDFEFQPAAQMRESVQELEQQGWRAFWIPELLGRREALTHAGYLLSVTEQMHIINGIAQIWSREAQWTHAAGLLLADAYPD